MTDDAEISPLVENRGTTFEVVILSATEPELHPTVWTTAFTFSLGGGKKTHISDLQHSGNMFCLCGYEKKNNMHN